MKKYILLVIGIGAGIVLGQRYFMNNSITQNNEVSLEMPNKFIYDTFRKRKENMIKNIENKKLTAEITRRINDRNRLNIEEFPEWV